MLEFCFEVSLARRQNLKLAWEDAWNHAKMELSVKWLSHGSVARILFVLNHAVCCLWNPALSQDCFCDPSASGSLPNLH